MNDGQLKIDLMKINVRESTELNFWCDEFNLKADELIDIVKIVGPAVHDVRLFLAKRLLISWPQAHLKSY